MSRTSGPRVVLTGMGAVSPWGWGARDLWRGLCSGRTAIGDFNRIDHTGYPTHVAGEVPRPPADLAARFRGWRHASWADRFGLASAAEALAQAGLPRILAGRRAGVFFGSSTGGMFECEASFAGWNGRSLAEIDIRPFGAQPVSAPGEAVAREFQVDGPVETVSAACSSAALAIESALHALREGIVDIAFAGGADSLCHVTYGGFNSLRSVDSRPSTPFRADRQGLSLGEGGAVLLLERADSAAGRGAQPIAELAGAGCSADAHHMTAPEPSGRGAALALRRALDDAAIEPGAVDLINAHGTGTELNDVAEYRALLRVFGNRVGAIPLTSTKAGVGHLLGTAGAIEAVATALCLRERIVHPTPGGGEIDPATPVHLVRGEPLAVPDLAVAISLNLAFGGCNGALVLRRGAGA